MKFILGEKQRMTQIYDEEGRAHPVTEVSAPPCAVTQVKENEKDGYQSVQIGSGERKQKNLTKALLGHFKGKGNFRYLREFRKKRGKDEIELKEGDKIDINSFSVGDKVNVSSISKGKGFQGVVKRYGFAGGPRSHGQRHTERAPGSIGAMGHARVQKGKRMPGRMGGERVTIKGLKMIAIDPENNKVYIRGAIPGTRGTLVEIVK